MKRSFYSAIVIFICISCQAQGVKERGEFATNSNGLMYNETDMKALRFIVDSLNLKFKTCDLSRSYYSMPQAKLYQFVFTSETNDLKSIIADLDKSNYTELAEKYRSNLHSSDTTLTIIKSKNSYLSGTPATGYERIYLSNDEKTTPKIVTGKWTYRYYPKQSYNKSYQLYCYYVPENFRSVVVPKEYAMLIQYVDCMIDTASVVYLTDKSEWGRFSSNPESYEKINDYINADMKIKKKGKDDWGYEYITTEKLQYAKEKLKNDSYFIRLVEEAADECMEAKRGNDALEELIGIFVSKETALTLKRSRRVMGQCSQDDSPRLHARNIAILSAEAHSWDIFLRAHLDIMNDRFDRVTDGSYAWGGRKTYLKELEELDLDIVDLMLGLTLRAENVADNHYYGTIWRMGWALTESKEKNVFEEKAIAMMKDNLLDEFNRGLVFLLYHTYLNYLDEKEGKQKRDELRKTIHSFPGFIQASIKEMKEPASKNK